MVVWFVAVHKFITKKFVRSIPYVIKNDARKEKRTVVFFGIFAICDTTRKISNMLVIVIPRLKDVNNITISPTQLLQRKDGKYWVHRLIE